MKGRWAAGIVPRNFAWIIKGHLAVSERPGGSAPAHRRVRRHEEILWLRAQGFTKVVSLLPSTHNLHAYEELGLAYEHVPMGLREDSATVLSELYPSLLGWLYAGERILVHQDELGDRIAGVFAGFLYWSGMIPQAPLAISATEQLLRRQLGTEGRQLVTLSDELEPPAPELRRAEADDDGPVLVAVPVVPFDATPDGSARLGEEGRDVASGADGSRQAPAPRQAPARPRPAKRAGPSAAAPRAPKRAASERVPVGEKPARSHKAKKPASPGAKAVQASAVKAKGGDAKRATSAEAGRATKKPPTPTKKAPVRRR